MQCGKGNRGSCWTSGRPPQHRAIVRKGHESSGVSCWFARKCSSISIAASDLANAFSLSRSVLFATKARSLSLSLVIHHQWKDHQPILVANIYRGEDTSAVKSKVHRLVAGKVRKEKRKEKRIARPLFVGRSTSVITLRGYSASFVTDRIPWLRTVLSRATTSDLVARSARQGAAGVFELMVFLVIRGDYRYRIAKLGYANERS